MNFEVRCCETCGRPYSKTVNRVAFDGPNVSFEGKTVRLTATHVAVMRLLARHFGETVHRETLYTVWSDRVSCSVKNLDVVICQLRKTLPALGLWIVTVHGYGYELRKAA